MTPPTPVLSLPGSVVPRRASVGTKTKRLLRSTPRVIVLMASAAGVLLLRAGDLTQQPWVPAPYLSGISTKSTPYFSRGKPVVKGTVTRQYAPALQQAVQFGSGMSAIGSLSAIFQQIAAFYSSMLALAPIATKCTTGALTWVLAEVIARKAKTGSPDSQSSGVDFSTRLARFSIFGAVNACLLHFYFIGLPCVAHVLRSLLPNMFAQINLSVLMVIIDQFCWTPMWYIVYFFPGIAMIEGEGMKALSARLSRDLRPFLKRSWMVWIPLNLVTFSIIPMEYRLTWSMACMLCYSVLLLIMSKGARKTEEAVMVTTEKYPELAQA